MSRILKWVIGIEVIVIIAVQAWFWFEDWIFLKAIYEWL